MQRIGVFVCWCGSNIAGTVDVQKVSDALKNEPGVVFSTNYQYMCSEAGQSRIAAAKQFVKFFKLVFQLIKLVKFIFQLKWFGQHKWWRYMSCRTALSVWRNRGLCSSLCRMCASRIMY